MLTTAEKIRVVTKRKDMTLTGLAKEMGITRQNLNAKLTNNRFTPEELLQVANILGIEYVSKFVLEDGSEI